MIHMRSLWIAILIGTAISCVNFFESFETLAWFGSSSASGTVSYGYGTLSLFANWINGGGGIGQMVFFLVYPLLAAIPFSWSLCREWQGGYTNQLLTRESKRTYLASKYVTVFASGGIAITLPLTVNFVLNAWILPICAPVAAMVGGGDALYLSYLLFTKPMLYLICTLLTDFCWGGLLACLGMTVSLFFKNTMVALLSPFVIFYGENVLCDAFVRTSGHKEMGWLNLLNAMTSNPAPVWYVWTILLGLLAAITMAYFLRGMRGEMF